MIKLKAKRPQDKLFDNFIRITKKTVERVEYKNEFQDKFGERLDGGYGQV